MLKAVLRLIRFPNLVVVAITQWLVATQILAQAFSQENLTPVLSNTELGLLIFATVIVAAIGYIVNDLADYEIDVINRPEKVIINAVIPAKTARRIAYTLALIGLLATLYLGTVKGELEWLWLYPFFVGLLLAYPTRLKRHHLAGNLFVAIACAGTAGLIWLAERQVWHSLSNDLRQQTGLIIVLFMLYGFISTWIREIIKDLEDEEGDRAQGRGSLVINWGKKRAKLLVYLLSLLLLASLGLIFITPNYQLFGTIGLGLVPVLMIIILLLGHQLHRAQSTVEYHRLSQYWKVYLLGGLSILLCYQLL